MRLKKQMEQKQIAECAMVPLKEARETLYKMLKGGFVTLQVQEYPSQLATRSAHSIPCSHSTISILSPLKLNGVISLRLTPFPCHPPLTLLAGKACQAADAVEV